MNCLNGHCVRRNFIFVRQNFHSVRRNYFSAFKHLQRYGNGATQWTDLDGFGRKWTEMDVFGRFWTENAATRYNSKGSPTSSTIFLTCLGVYVCPFTFSNGRNLGLTFNHTLNFFRATSPDMYGKYSMASSDLP